MDMRGYGDSDKPGALEDYKMPRLVNDIKEIIEALGTYLGTVHSLCQECSRNSLPVTKKNSLQSVRYCTLFIFCYLNTLVLIFMWRHMVRRFEHYCFVHSAVFIRYK